MKREFKQVQKIIDDSLAAALSEGGKNNAELLFHIRNVLVDNLTTTGDISAPYMLDVLSRLEFTNSKQRLCKAGVIEITKGNEPKLIEQLSSDDIEFIDGRDARQIAGRLKERVLFNNKHGRPRQAQEASSQLALFSRQEIEEAHPVATQS